MEWYSPGAPAPAGSISHAGSPGSLSGGATLLRLLERARNVEEVEELLLAAAVHPEGAGFARAWLLRWDPEHDRLSQVRWALGPLSPVPLAECVQQLRSAAPSSVAGNGALDAYAGTIEAARLDSVSAAAWSRGGIALGTGEAAGRPGMIDDGGVGVRTTPITCPGACA